MAPKQMEYLDFSIRILPKQGNAYPVIVMDSPAGYGDGELSLPFDPGESGDLLTAFSQSVRGGQSPVARGEVSPGALRTTPEKMGDQLFTSLFSGQVGKLFERSLGILEGQNKGLRIKLHLDPNNPSLAQLATLPWEFLYIKEERRFLNQSISTPVVRFLEVQRAYKMLDFEPPLLILVAMADPLDSGLPNLDLERERHLIEKHLMRLSGVQVDILKPATKESLMDKLGERDYHVLHYMGHAEFNEASGMGSLLLEDDDQLKDPLSGKGLSVILNDRPSVRLAFLNACETAKFSKDPRYDPFAGVAAALVMAGLSAVVAMQFPISDEAAIVFSKSFYSQVARGRPVDVAVSEGRKAVSIRQEDSNEWGTPVLFMRVPQGQVFRLHGKGQLSPAGISGDMPTPTIQASLERMPSQETTRQTESSEPASNLTDAATKPSDGPAQARQIEDLYREGMRAFFLEEWQAAAQKLEQVAHLRPDYKQAAESLSEAQRRIKAARLYQLAEAAAEIEDWVTVEQHLEQIKREVPEHAHAQALEKRLRKHQTLELQYNQALEAIGEGELESAQGLLEQVVALDAEYHDARALLESVQGKLTRIREQEQALRVRRETLRALYQRAKSEMQAEHWMKARESLEEILAMEHDYPGAVMMLKQVKAKIALEEFAMQDSAPRPVVHPAPEAPSRPALDEPYQRALDAISNHDLDQAEELLKLVMAIDPSYQDAGALLDQVRRNLAKRQVARQQIVALIQLYSAKKREEKLRGLYAGARIAMEAGYWSAARSQLEELLEENPDNLKAVKRLEEVEKMLSPMALEATTPARVNIQARPSRVLTGHWSAVRSIAFSPDSRKLVSGSGGTILAGDKSVRLWRIKDGKLLHTMSGNTGTVYCVAYSPDGRLLVSAGGGEYEIQVWSVANGKNLFTLKRHSGDVHGLAISPDGKTLASCGEGGNIYLWDLIEGRYAGTIRLGNTGNGVAFSPDNELLACVTSGGTIALWWTGQTGASPFHRFVGASGSWQNSIRFSVDGSLIASKTANATIGIWRYPTKEPIRVFESPDSVFALDFSPDGNFLAAGYYTNQLRLWRVRDGELLRTKEKHTKQINCVVFSPDGRLLATASDDNTVQLWRLTYS